MILVLEIILILFFLFNMGILIRDYMHDEKEVNFMNMVYVLACITVLVLINFFKG